MPKSSELYGVQPLREKRAKNKHPHLSRSPYPYDQIYRVEDGGVRMLLVPVAGLSIDDPVNLSSCPSPAFTPSFPCPSHTPWISDIVLSKLLRLVLGLVIVVPKLACRECPRLKPPPRDGLMGLVGLVGEYTGEPGICTGGLVLMLARGKPAVITFSSLAVTPLGVMGGGTVSGFSDGVVGSDDMMALPSSESASKRSGGSRSFSISDLRLGEHVIRWETAWTS